jgi:glycosyltransferase involved in cell wall biosynthesis
LYQAADVFVLPSVTEGLSNALLEALSCGLPVLGSRVCGIVDVIQTGTHGLLFDPFDANDIETHLQEMTENVSLRGKMSGAARWVGQQHSLDQTVREYVNLYEGKVL